MKTFTIKTIDEENQSFWIGDVRVGYTNYDEHGWSGMHATCDLFLNIAFVIGATVEYQDVL